MKKTVFLILLFAGIIIYLLMMDASAQTLPGKPLPSLTHYPKEVGDLYAAMDKDGLSNTISIIIQDSGAFYLFKNEKFSMSGKGMTFKEFCDMHGVRGSRVWTTSHNYAEPLPIDQTFVLKYRDMIFPTPALLMKPLVTMITIQ